MEATSGLAQDSTSAQTADSESIVTACESRPGRYVFIESGNTDGWIATDLAVDLER